MVPSNGEHFTIRPATNAGEYILDIKDARGNLVRSAGMLRPQSVARAAVLPPSLAAQLGAEGSFDRFEFTAEGEATAHVLAQALRSRGVKSTRLARGVPVGSELEYVDLGTIAHALVDRR